MTDKWPLHPSVMSYSIAEVEMTGVKAAVARLNTTREEAIKHLGVLNQYANGGENGEYPFAARVIQDRLDLEDELARVREELKQTHAKMMLNHDAAVNATQQMKKLREELITQRQWKETAYSERAKLVSLLTRLFPAHVAQHDSNDTSWDREWLTIVFVQLPTGQASWHIHLNDIPLFDHLKDGENNWDGHTTEEKYHRVLSVRADMLDRDRIDLVRQLRDTCEKRDKLRERLEAAERSDIWVAFASDGMPREVTRQNFEPHINPRVGRWVRCVRVDQLGGRNDK